MRDALIEAMRHAISFTPMWDGDTIGDNLTRDEIVTAATRALEAALSILENPNHDMTAAVVKPGHDRDFAVDMFVAMLNTLKAPA